MTEREDGDQVKVEIPGYNGRIKYFGKIPIHLDEFTWRFQTPEGERAIPGLSVWNYENHQKIADTIVQGKRIAMYMWGTYGTGYLLNFEEWQKKDTDEAKALREQLKIGRPKDKSFPVLIHPDDMHAFWDFNSLHPSLKHLKDAQNRYDAYQSGPVHLIAPRKENGYLDESLRWPLDNTLCGYYMPHPPWERIIGMTRRDIKHAVFGGGSLNPHKKEPVYRTGDLYRKIQETAQWIEGIDLIVVCEISESTEVYRSQTQIRLAQKESDGISEVIRRGSMLSERWSQEQGIPVKDAEKGVEEAASLWPYDDKTNEVVDAKVLDGIKLMKEFDKQAINFAKAA